jgi:hypothetical protein
MAAPFPILYPGPPAEGSDAEDDAVPARIIFDQFSRREVADWAAAQPGSSADRGKLTRTIIQSIIDRIEAAPDLVPAEAERVPGRTPPTYRLAVYPNVWLWYTIDRASRWKPWRPDDVVTVIRFG